MADLNIETVDVLAILAKLTQPVEVKWIDNPFPRGSQRRWTWNFLKVCHFRWKKLIERFDGLDDSEAFGYVGGLRNHYKHCDDLINQLCWILHRVDEKKLDGNFKTPPDPSFPNSIRKRKNGTV